MINTLLFCFVMKSIRAPGRLFTRNDNVVQKSFLPSVITPSIRKCFMFVADGTNYTNGFPGSEKTELKQFVKFNEKIF